MLDSIYVTVFENVLFRRYCTIKISVIWSITKNKKKVQVVFLVLRYFKFIYIYIWCGANCNVILNLPHTCTVMFIGASV